MKKRKTTLFLVCMIVIIMYIVGKIYKSMRKDMRSGIIKRKRNSNSELKEFPVDIFLNKKKHENKTINDEKHHLVVQQHQPKPRNVKEKLQSSLANTEKEYGEMGSAVK